MITHSHSVALELLRQRRSIISDNTYYNHYRDGDRAQREYNSIAIRERSKFERETLNKYGGVDYTSNMGAEYLLPGASRATLAVITLIVAIDGDSKVPSHCRGHSFDKAFGGIKNNGGLLTVGC